MRSNASWWPACAPDGALRVPRARTTRAKWAHVTSEGMISQRPAEVADRAVPGQWEGDLLIEVWCVHGASAGLGGFHELEHARIGVGGAGW